jgi:hypothetical protein
MDRAIPFLNKICLQKSIERDMMIHKENINNMRGVCDREAPDTMHLLNRPKIKTAK